MKSLKQWTPVSAQTQYFEQAVREHHLKKVAPIIDSFSWDLKNFKNMVHNKKLLEKLCLSVPGGHWAKYVGMCNDERWLQVKKHIMQSVVILKSKHV